MQFEEINSNVPVPSGETDLLFEEERARVIQKIAMTLKVEEFPLSVETIQALFREAEDPFEILPRAGVFLSQGKNSVALSEAFVDLWNYTTRRELGERAPLERLREGGVAANGRRLRNPWALLEACKICLAPHNLHLEEEAATNLEASNGKE